MIVMNFPDLIIKAGRMQIAKLNRRPKYHNFSVHPLPAVPIENLKDPNWWIELANVPFKHPYTKCFCLRPLGANPDSEDVVAGDKPRWYWKVALVTDEIPNMLLIKVYEKAELDKLSYVDKPFEIRSIDLKSKKWAGVKKLYKPKYSGLFDYLFAKPLQN